jgi:hypothetical protein
LVEAEDRERAVREAERARAVAAEAARAAEAAAAAAGEAARAAEAAETAAGVKAATGTSVDGILEQPDNRRPPSRDEIAVVATLDIVGLSVTIIVAILLAVINVTSTGRWLAIAALGAATLIGVATTVTLIQLLARRRRYIAEGKKAALLLESHLNSKSRSSYLRDAEMLRDEAIEFGEEDLAARLNTAIYAADPRARPRRGVRPEPPL